MNHDLEILARLTELQEKFVAHTYDIMTRLSITNARLLTIEMLLQETLYNKTAPLESTEQDIYNYDAPNVETKYIYPHSELKGDGTDNQARQIQYNNVEYSDYERFLRGWIDFYATININLTQSDIERLESYKQELERLIIKE